LFVGTQVFAFDAMRGYDNNKIFVAVIKPPRTSQNILPRPNLLEMLLHEFQTHLACNISALWPQQCTAGHLADRSFAARAIPAGHAHRASLFLTFVSAY
jgi:hypothetical protein